MKLKKLNEKLKIRFNLRINLSFFFVAENARPEPCNYPKGSEDPWPDPQTQQCRCKSGFTGTLCTSISTSLRCPVGEFYSNDEDECISCFCMGIPADNEGTPTQCQSANLPKSLAKVEFYDDTRGFSLANEDFTSEISELKTDTRERELYFDEIEDLEEYVSKIELSTKKSTKNQLRLFRHIFGDYQHNLREISWGPMVGT